MDKKTIGLKYVKKANMWCVTVFSGEDQRQSWFKTEEQALSFRREKEKEQYG